MARELSTDRQVNAQRHASDLGGHPKRRDENSSGFQGADGADVKSGIKGTVEGMNVNDYKPGKATFRGDADPKDYNTKAHSRLETKKDVKFKDTGKDATSAPIETSKDGILGNTKNVARDPGKSGKNKTPGFGGKEGPEIAKSRRGGLSADRDTDEKGVGEAVRGGILGNTSSVARNPVGGSAKGNARNVEGFHGGTVGDGYIR